MNFRDYATQAQLSVYLAAIGGVSTLISVVLMARNFDRATFWIIYNARRPFVFVLLATIGLALLASGLGLLVGFMSAGQRRNPKSQLSWTGFFSSAAVLAVALSAAVFFILTQNPRGGQ
ncbi:MAG: hypothetical protein U1D55_09490 [Phycisphaerae bacterium]